MAVAFDADDKDRISAILVRTAEQLFSSQGLKKTSLEELTAPAEIAKTSFYAFFESKEALYLEVMVRRGPAIGKELAKVLSRPPSAETLAALMRTATETLVTDPFYRRLFTHPEELRAVQRRVGDAEIARVNPIIVSPLLDYLRRGQADGVIVDDVDADVVLGVIRTVGLIVLHRESFGDRYDQVLAATIRALAIGLTVPGGPTPKKGRGK